MVFERVALRSLGRRHPCKERANDGGQAQSHSQKTGIGRVADPTIWPTDTQRLFGVHLNMTGVSAF